MKEEEEKFSEIIKRYNLDIKKLEEEQIKLSKSIVLKDSVNFEEIERIAGIDNVFIKNNIISAIIILANGEEEQQEYFSDKLRFPYLPNFKAYRELPSMLGAIDKIDIKPDLVIIKGEGIIHPRNLGIASHFSLATGIPTIGVTDNLSEEYEIKEDNIYCNGKIAGKVLKTKEGANPIYISPGNMISLETSVKIIKGLIKEPHKIPEPLRLARKYAKEIGKELFSESN